MSSNFKIKNTNSSPDDSKSNEIDSLKNKYQKKTDKQHILDNPDTYTGSIEEIDDESGWVFNNDKMMYKQYKYIPGFFKLFDESIVNCRDHVIRMKTKTGSKIKQVSYIDIDIDRNTGIITMSNDGDGIDVIKHPEYDIWIPEMIFAHLRTSTNYNKNEKKIVGGKNGFGIKLVLIWSKWGKIETVDHHRQLKYTQEFSNNLDVINKPKIRKISEKASPYTKVSFLPDFEKFGFSNVQEMLSDDIMSLFEKRIYDIAAITGGNIKVKYNKKVIPTNNFQKYVDLYIGNKTERPRVYESNGDRWEYVVAITPDAVSEFMHVSFVNGIYTSKGGKHVEYILNQITKKMIEFIKKKKKITVRPSTIKEHLMLFLRCDIDNPSFDSQTKDYLNTPSSKFGSTCKISDQVITKLAKMGVMDMAVSLSEIKTNNSLKKNDGKKVKNIRGITKLTDANFAGTNKSKECILILCEGDSAKTGIISGLVKEDRNYIGVYPLKGKIMNVAGEKREKIYNNAEIKDIIQILGLKSDTDYSDQGKIDKLLRYGKVIFMTDQDLDGSHIKALGVNLFYNEWGCLLKIPQFLGFMNTPIIKATKGKQVKEFYNEQLYNEWKDTLTSTAGWNIKYYKGLGTSTGKEFKEYLNNRKLIYFTYSDDTCHDRIDLAFNKKRPDDRKTWLNNYNRNDYLILNDDPEQNISYRDFIDLDLKHYSIYDNERSIPNLVDGLKVSQRKIVFAAFKKNLVKEIKVAQFSGYVSEKTAYHHGEASLNAAIKGLAQNYIGSNTVNLLMPSGQFGTRLQGGKDAGSERYIYTYLNPITRKIFPETDDNILQYLDDDGQSIQPEYYIPIIPMALVNGSIGIGTGFSTQILSYNPVALIQWMKLKLTGGNPNKFIEPYYHGFTGDIINLTVNSNDENSVPKYLIKGKYRVINNYEIEITELPLMTWTENYKQQLEKMLECKNPVIKDYTDMCTDSTISFKIKFYDNIFDLCNTLAEYGCSKLEKILKLYTTLSTANMYLFNEDKCLTKYNSIYDIIETHMQIRLKGYIERKAFYLGILNNELKLLKNKVKFITENLEGSIDLRRKKKDEIDLLLAEKEYDQIENNYNYLTRMTMDSVTEEKVQELTEKLNNKQTELDNLVKKTPSDMWLDELNDLESELNKIGITFKHPSSNLKVVKKLKISPK